MDLGHERVGVGRDDCERPDPLPTLGVFPVLPQTANAKRLAVLHGDRVRLFGLLPFDCLPLEETVDRHDAASLAVRLAECRQGGNRLAFRVDRLSTSTRILAPVRNEAPAKRIE